jgi:hypothetical protein
MRCGMAWQLLLLTRHHTATPILHLLAPVVRRNYPLLPRRQSEVFGIASFVTRGCSQPLSWLFQHVFSPSLHAGCMSLSLACHSHRIPRFFFPPSTQGAQDSTGTIASEMCNLKAWTHFHMRSIRVGQQPLGGASGVRSHETSSLSPVRSITTRYTCH